MTTLVIAASVVVIGILYSLKSLIVVRANEMALKFTFGRVTGLYQPGLRFCPWLLSSVVIYEKTPLTFQIKVPDVVTKTGKVKGNQNDREIKRTTVDVTVALTLYFSNNLRDLSLTAERVGDGSNDIEVLAKAIRPFIDSVVRSVFSEMPWMLSYQERVKMTEYLMSRISSDYRYYSLKTEEASDSKNNNDSKSYYFSETKDATSEVESSMKRYNPLLQFHFDMKRTSILINRIDFSDPNLTKLMNLAEGARLEKEVASINQTQARREGDTQAYIMETKGKALANSRALMIKAIKDNPNLEYLRALEAFSQGPATKLIYQIPKIIEDGLAGVFGNNKVDDLQLLLKDPEIVKVIKEAISSITKR